MDNIKKAGNVFANYIIVMIVYIVFLYTFISIAGDAFMQWLPLYSILMFLLLFYLVYNDMKVLAAKEMRPSYEIEPYPLRGLVLGLIAAIPVGIFEILNVLIVLDNEIANNLKRLVFYAIIGPLYFVIALAGENALLYLIVYLLIPVICMLGYLAGYYNFSFKKLIGKDDDKHKGAIYGPSPWNPFKKDDKDNKK